MNVNWRFVIGLTALLRFGSISVGESQQRRGNNSAPDQNATTLGAFPIEDTPKMNIDRPVSSVEDPVVSLISVLQFLKRLGYLCVLVFLSSLSSAVQTTICSIYGVGEYNIVFGPAGSGPQVAQSGPYDIFKSTRPDHVFRTSNLQVHDGCGAPGAAPGCRCFKSLSDDDAFSARINALRCIFNASSCFSLRTTRTTAAVFVWNFGSPGCP